MVIQLIGGIGSGKSRVLSLLQEEYGAEVVQTDLEAKALERRGEKGYEAIVDVLGDWVVGRDGELDTARLAERLFADEGLLAKVNGIIHPLVWERVRRRVEAFRQRTQGECAAGDGFSMPLLVVETALPLKRQETDDIYDEIWYIHTLEETRIGRLMKGRGYSRGKCLAVMGRQPTEAEYRGLADRVIDNNGDMESLRRQIAPILAKLQRGWNANSPADSPIRQGEKQ